MKKDKWIWLSGLVLLSGATIYALWRRTNRKKTTSTKLPQTDLSGSQKSQIKVATEPNWEDPFDMNYARDVAQWLAPKRVQNLPASRATQLAKKIKEAKGKWYTHDNEQAVYDVFAKQLKDRVQVANLSQAFWQSYQLDLWEYLNGFLSQKEMQKHVHQPVKKLAPYSLS